MAVFRIFLRYAACRFWNRVFAGMKPDPTPNPEPTPEPTPDPELRQNRYLILNQHQNRSQNLFYENGLSDPGRKPAGNWCYLYGESSDGFTFKPGEDVTCVAVTRQLPPSTLSQKLRVACVR